MPDRAPTPSPTDLARWYERRGPFWWPRADVRLPERPAPKPSLIGGFLKGLVLGPTLGEAPPEWERFTLAQRVLSPEGARDLGGAVGLLAGVPFPAGAVAFHATARRFRYFDPRRGKDWIPRAVHVGMDPVKSAAVALEPKHFPRLGLGPNTLAEALTSQKPERWFEDYPGLREAVEAVRLMPVRLRVENALPIHGTARLSPEDLARLREAARRVGENPELVVRDFTTHYRPWFLGALTPTAPSDRPYNALADVGFDAILYRDLDTHPSWAVFDPTKVEAAHIDPVTVPYPIIRGMLIRGMRPEGSARGRHLPYFSPVFGEVRPPDPTLVRDAMVRALTGGGTP